MHAHTHMHTHDRVTGGLFSQYTHRAECNRRRHIFARGEPHSLVVWGYYRPPPCPRSLIPNIWEVRELHFVRANLGSWPGPPAVMHANAAGRRRSCRRMLPAPRGGGSGLLMPVGPQRGAFLGRVLAATFAARPSCGIWPRRGVAQVLGRAQSWLRAHMTLPPRRGRAWGQRARGLWLAPASPGWGRAAPARARG